jgi:transcriptional regulator GlxA family with amidase domain
VKASGRIPLNVAIVLYEGVEILDFAGPAEVFESAATLGADREVPAFAVYTTATSREPIVSQGFIDIIPDHAVADAPTSDIVVIPGGSSDVMLRDETLMAWLKRSVENAQLTMTVCTGAMAAASLGVLDGLTVTTHHGSLARLQGMAPKAKVEANRRFVDNGRIVTTAGVSAGIDGALHVVANLLGRKVADDTAWYMEYSWTPDETHAKGYSYLDPSRDERGQRLQVALNEFTSGDFSKAESVLRGLLAEDDTDGYAWMLLTETLRSQQRWGDALEAARRTREFDGWQVDGLYLEAAVHARLGHTDEAFGALSEAVALGFNERWRLERDDDLTTLRDDPRFAPLLEATA